MTTKISGDNISAIANTGVNWNAVTVADGSTTLNASAGNGYLLDTNTGVIEVFLPSSPTRGDTVILSDYAGTFATNNVIVNSGTNNIDSTVGSEFILSTNNRIAEFVYIDSNKGWLYKGATTRGSTPSQAGVPVYDTDTAYITATGGTITESGDFRIHTFTGDGCFVVSQAGLGAGPSVVDYLVVAGGGSGGSRDRAGGGGAGGYRESSGNSGCYSASPLATPTGITVSVTTYPITVGGGAAANPPVSRGNQGSASTFSTITSAGGGAGGGDNPDSVPNLAGGSGGGRGIGGIAPGPVAPGGAGNTPPVSPPQGNNGGGGQIISNGGSGGGGGAGAAGGDGSGSSPGTGGAGGNGVTTSITGSPVTRAGGGGGLGDSGPQPGGSGGGGAGGTFSPGGTRNGIPGSANTGGGGGGSGCSYTGGEGGKGIVVIRYKYQ